MAAKFEQIFHVMGNRFAEDNPGECVAGEELSPEMEVKPSGTYCPLSSDMVDLDGIALYWCRQGTRALHCTTRQGKGWVI